MSRSVNDGVTLHDAHREAGHIEVTGPEQPRMLGQLAPHDGAPGPAAPCRDPRHHLANLVRVDPAQQLVVEEEERTGPAANQVVHAHGDQVDTDGVQAAGRDRHRHLGAHPIRARDQHRAAVAPGHLEQAAEAPDPADHLRPVRGGGHQIAHGLDRLVGGVDVDPGRGVGESRRGDLFRR